MVFQGVTRVFLATEHRRTRRSVGMISGMVDGCWRETMDRIVPCLDLPTLT